MTPVDVFDKTILDRATSVTLSEDKDTIRVVVGNLILTYTRRLRDWAAWIDVYVALSDDEEVKLLYYCDEADSKVKDFWYSLCGAYYRLMSDKSNAKKTKIHEALRTLNAEPEF